VSREAVDDNILRPWFGPDHDIHEIRSVSVGQMAGLQDVSVPVSVAVDRALRAPLLAAPLTGRHRAMTAVRGATYSVG